MNAQFDDTTDREPWRLPPHGLLQRAEVRAQPRRFAESPAAPSAFGALEGQARLTPADHMAAEERLLSDADLFLDWLGSQCFQQSRVEIGYVPLEGWLDEARDKFYDSLERRSPAELIVLALQGNDWAKHAMTELSRRYVAAHNDYLIRLASELSEDA